MERFTEPELYAVWSKDSNIRYHSTSGGAFSEFAKAVLATGGLICGAKYNSSNLVEHAIADTLSGIAELRQSKYVSSSVGDCYKQVRAALETGRQVAFCGTPCQVAGLYAFLGKEYDNLFTMDFICRGVNSPKAYRAWLDEIEKKQGSPAVKVWFKYKEGGWKSSPLRTRVDFADGSHQVYAGEKNLYMYGYLSSNLYIRPCCGSCRFKGVPRKSDVTFADFWGIDPELDDDKGTSMVLVNSPKGKAMFERVKGVMEVHPRELGAGFSENPMFTDSVYVPENGHDFLLDLDRLSFSADLKKYGAYPVKRPLWRRALSKAKRTVKHMLRMEV